jgi:transcription antitermination factor NusG
MDATHGFASSAAADLHWYAIQVETRLGSLASATLHNKGYEALLPLYRARRQWSDRVKEVSLPLFPGYLFCRFDVRGRILPILTTPGVMSIVGAGKTPVPVEEVEMENIRTLLRSGHAPQPWPFLSAGERVYIERGPLAGLEGIISEADKMYRLVVSVTLLQRSVAVEIDREWARPVTQRAKPNACAFEKRTDQGGPHPKCAAGPSVKGRSDRHRSLPISGVWSSDESQGPRRVRPAIQPCK